MYPHGSAVVPPPPPAAQQTNPNLVDVNQLVEALILHKEKQRATRQRRPAKSDQGDDEVDDDEDDGEGEDREEDSGDDDEDAVGEANQTVGTAATTARPARSVCKGVKEGAMDVDDLDGAKASRVEGVICVKSFGHSEENKTVAPD